ncbi:hypothetical protein COU18_03790 [Candidatus Kaiserbacteria bacterium CG10_big_fil_rev_8_21_14_0_10_51_14]|uniref:Uncharacterized protein n=1 Tax=Candidatus Kaiserbacteria bacterium CG10_big_fil_rev_8_21_14_0_10_51_14 TaxID=1974610 RepID=A0A2H0UDL5_9BACT|nr:MAG: hypothetical protein COU18_03790 [Candidatus Kaiserbacteria bacterium CG10_big_fil_rev_8_21_14_0_10_51_14]
MVLEQYEKEAEKIELKKEGPEAVGPTVKTILADTKLSARFGDYLEAEGEAGMDPGKEGLAIKLKNGKLDPGDLKKLEVYREDFLFGMSKVDSIIPRLDKASIEEIAKKSPELQEILKVVGVEGVSFALKNQMHEFAMKNQSKFQEISAAFETLDAYKSGEFEKLDKKIAEKCKKAGIDVETFARIMQKDTGRVKELEKEVGSIYKSSKDIIKKWSKGKVFGSHKSAKEWALSLSREKKQMDEALATVREDTKKIGELLSLTVDTDPTMREVLTRELVGDKRIKEPKSFSFKEMKNLGTEADREKAAKTHWEEYKKSPEYQEDLKVGPDAPKTKFKDGEMKRFKEAHGGGFWMRLMEIFFGNTLDKVTK